MKAYGMNSESPMLCCPADTPWPLKSKFGKDIRNRKAQRRSFKARARRANKKATREAL